MSAFFLLNNLHFSVEIMGALVFGAVAWLAFDSFLLRRDFTSASRGIGFLMLAAWQIVHAVGPNAELWGYVGYAFLLLGITFVIWNLTLERPVKRPYFTPALIILPSLSVVLPAINALAAIGYFIIAALAYRQYRHEFKKALAPFWLAFLFWSFGALFSLFYPPESLGMLWALGHIFELLGFAALAFWVWKYLELRVREEILLILVSLTLFMAVIVSLTFSSILTGRIEAETRNSLMTDTQVIGFAIDRLEEEAFAKARVIAKDPRIRTALVGNDFEALERALGEIALEEDLGFLAALSAEGEVILRANAVSRKRESIADERAVAEALKGMPFATIERETAEGFAIRASAPVFDADEEVAGAIITGFPLDNAFADNIKKLTGLEMTIFSDTTRVATTIFAPDGRTRNIGTKEENTEVRSSVLGVGEATTLRTTILSRPFVASYLPLENADGEVVGMVSSARSQKDILETAEATNKLTLLIVVVIMLLLVVPLYVVTGRLSGEVR